MFEFIILFSKTMSELKKAWGLTMEIQGSLSHSFCLLMTNEKHSKERSGNVEFGGIMCRAMNCDDKKIVHLDDQGTMAYISQFLISTWDFQFLESKRQCSISSYSPGTLTKVETIEPMSARGAHRLSALITRA